MTNERRKNFAKADEELAKQWSTPEVKLKASDIEKWRDANQYTWHELNDMSTIQLMPRNVNGAFNHLGGVGEYNLQ